MGKTSIPMLKAEFLSVLYICTVKVCFVFILLLLTALGTCFPCCMHDGCAIENPASSAKEDGHNEAACSPFFACATCPGAVELPRAVAPPAPEIRETPQHQAFYLTRLSTYSTSFFQPPRIC